MRIGFTGTRFGMKPAQLSAVCELLRRLNVTEFHHGDCVGADDEAATSCALMSHAPVRTVVHPPVDETHRAHNKDWWHIVPPKTHFARNRDIVDETEALIAAPFDEEERPKGGTWYTVNYARKKGKPVFIAWPSGITTPEK